MTEDSGNIEWYLAREGQQHGPLSDTELNKFIELGHLKPMDLLWRAGFDDWRPATEIFPPRAPVAPEASQAPVQPVAESAPAPVEPAAPIQTSAPSGGGEMHPGTAPETYSSGPSGETTQPIRNHSVNQGQQASPTGVAGAGVAAGAPTAQPGTAFHAEPHGNQQQGFAPGGGPTSGQMPAPGQPTQEAQMRHGTPAAGQADASTPYGYPQHAASAVTQRPHQLQPAFGAAPQSSALHPTASASRPQDDELDDDEFLEDETDGRSGWLMVAAALFLFVLLGAGGLFAYNNQPQIAALYSDLAGSAKSNDVAVVRAPQSATREPADKVASLNAPKPVAAAKPAPAPVPELPIFKSKLWQFAQKEFGAWTKHRLAELAEQQKSKQEANDYLIASFVRFRRENAGLALLASPDQLKLVATSFVDSLRALTAKGTKACYAFISNGESAPEVAPLYFEPSVGPKIEAQMLAVLQAIAEGRTSPTKGQKPPTESDFNALSAELGRSGWSAGDLKLFSDPTALSQADPKLVCRLVTEWFATQTTLGNQTARNQLIAASLRPVIGG